VLAEAAQKAGSSGAELAARVALADGDLRRPAEALASVERGVALTQDASLPEDMRAAALVFFEAARVKLDPTNKYHSRGSLSNGKILIEPLADLAQTPLIARDALAQDTALLWAMPRLPHDRDAARTTATLEQVAKDARLAEHHPLRQVAQLRLANAAAAGGDVAAAQRWFAATGLSEQQCALIGPKPALTGVNTDAYPTDAMKWGFEGWVRNEYDINADGHTAGVRAVIAYPPFIFADAATRIMATAHYQASYRPSGGAACSASSESLNFRIPGNVNTVSLVPAKKPKR
jgi:hypothetical protein